MGETNGVSGGQLGSCAIRRRAGVINACGAVKCGMGARQLTPPQPPGWRVSGV